MVGALGHQGFVKDERRVESELQSFSDDSMASRHMSGIIRRSLAVTRR